MLNNREHAISACPLYAFACCWHINLPKCWAFRYVLRRPNIGRSSVLLRCFIVLASVPSRACASSPGRKRTSTISTQQSEGSRIPSYLVFVARVYLGEGTASPNGTWRTGLQAGTTSSCRRRGRRRRLRGESSSTKLGTSSVRASTRAGFCRLGCVGVGARLMSASFEQHAVYSEPGVSRSRLSCLCRSRRFGRLLRTCGIFTLHCRGT